MIKQIIPSEVCLSCKGCCRYKERVTPWAPTLLNEEVSSRLEGSVPAAFISSDKKIRLITDHSGNNAFVCPCLNPLDDTCNIYDNRPLECRLYPLVFALADAQYVLGIDAQCPFVEQNLLDPEFRKYIDEITAYFHSAQGRRILQKNPHLFQEYAGIAVLSQLKPHGSIQDTITSAQETV